MKYCVVILFLFVSFASAKEAFLIQVKRIETVTIEANSLDTLLTFEFTLNKEAALSALPNNYGTSATPGTTDLFEAWIAAIDPLGNQYTTDEKTWRARSGTNKLHYVIRGASSGDWYLKNPEIFLQLVINDEDERDVPLVQAVKVPGFTQAYLGDITDEMEIEYTPTKDWVYIDKLPYANSDTDALVYTLCSRYGFQVRFVWQKY